MLISDGLPHPFGLALNEDRLYWTDWETNSIQSANKLDGSEVVTIRDNLDDLMDIHFFHRHRERGKGK